MNTDRLHILIVGCGGREHAIAKALYKSKYTPRLFCFGTYRNPGIYAIATAYAVSDSLNNIQSIVEFAVKSNIDFAIVGPEGPLESGVTDALIEKGVNCIGPYQDLARLETSKLYTRKLMNKYKLSNFSPKWKCWESDENRGVVYDDDAPTNKITTESHYNQLKSKNFSSIEHEVRDFINTLNGNFVIKADGLKGGKGVYVSGDHFRTTNDGIELCRQLYNERETFIIEKKLEGEEFSLITFTDGIRFAHCPVVRDYKRAHDGNTGPNTGGMGSITCANHLFEWLSSSDLTRAQEITQNIVKALMIDNGGLPYVGIVYGGFMKMEHTDINDESIRVIEYNCRFGDPEAINLLELLDTDFVDLCLDLINRSLVPEKVKFKQLDSKCVYVVPKGYPNTKHSNFVIKKELLEHIIGADDRNVDLIISGIQHVRDIKNHNEMPLHKGNVYIEDVQTIGENEVTYKTTGLHKIEREKINTVKDGKIVTDSPLEIELTEIVIDGVPSSQPPSETSGLLSTGSRTFALIGVGKRGIENLERILDVIRNDYDINDQIYFRRDIGDGIHNVSETKYKKGLYATAGVNIETSNEAVASIQHFVKQTHTPYVIENDGGFGGMISIPQSDLIMINSTDSVGSKSVFVRQWWGKTRGMSSLGYDIVNHCVNDILVQSPDVRPWTFLDYFATHTLDSIELKWFVQGVSEACRKVGCVLIGGETAEIPGIYRQGCHDLVGAITGLVEKDKILQPKQSIEPGDLVIGISSDSPHTNGFTLIQHLIRLSKENGDFSYLRYVDDWAKPHRCYMHDVQKLRDAGFKIKGLCHITGGGFIDNPKRILPQHLDINFNWDLIDYEMPEWMKWLRNKMEETDPNFDVTEVRRTFNCGIGMLIVIENRQIDLNSITNSTNIEKLHIVGTIVTKGGDLQNA